MQRTEVLQVKQEMLAPEGTFPIFCRLDSFQVASETEMVIALAGFEDVDGSQPKGLNACLDDPAWEQNYQIIKQYKDRHGSKEKCLIISEYIKLLSRLRSCLPPFLFNSRT